MGKAKYFKIKITGETINGDFQITGERKLRTCLRSIRRFRGNKILIENTKKANE